MNCVSPGGEIIVFGHGNKIITFTSKYICVNLLNLLYFTIFNFLVKWFSSPTNDNIICQTFQTFLSNAIDEAKKYVILFIFVKLFFFCT